MYGDQSGEFGYWGIKATRGLRVSALTRVDGITACGGTCQARVITETGW